jgi:1-acyl-sn-glycerol-3-phosphate acyltransferase
LSATRAGIGDGSRWRVPAVQFAGSLFFTVFLFVWTGSYAIAFVIMCLFLPFARRFALVRFYARVMLWVLKWSCGLDYRIEGEPLPAGSHVALWKHSSSWETIAMMVVFPRQVWVLKRELLWIPVVGLGLRQLHSIAIDRKAGHSAVAQVVEQGKARLAEDDWVIIYPEGTRMPVGVTRRYGVSGTLLASETGRLIVPVAHNAGFYWPRRGLMKKPGTVRVVIGPAVSASGRDVRVVNEEIQQWVEATVRRLQPGQDL